MERRALLGPYPFNQDVSDPTYAINREKFEMSRIFAKKIPNHIQIYISKKAAEKNLSVSESDLPKILGAMG